MPRCQTGETSFSSTWTKSPSENYIKFILTKDRESDLSDLAEEFDDEGIILPERKVEYLKKLEHMLLEKMPEPFRPEDLRHAHSQKFLHEQEIWSLWHPDRFVEAAVLSFKSRTIRERINSLLTSGFGSVQISHLLATGLAIYIAEGSIEIYRHYFWSTELLTASEKEAALQSAKAGPIVATAYRAGNSLIGKADVLRYLGHNIEDPPVQELVREIRRHVLSTIPLTSEQPSSRRPKYLLDLAAALETANRTESMSQGESLSDVFIKLSNHIQNKRSPTSSISSSELAKPEFRPKGLPGRHGDLAVIDAEEVGTDGDDGKTGERTGKG